MYILIDTSESMKEHLPLLKDKLYQLMQVGGCSGHQQRFRRPPSVGMTDFTVVSGAASLQSQSQLCGIWLASGLLEGEVDGGD